MNTELTNTIKEMLSTEWMSLVTLRDQLDMSDDIFPSRTAVDNELKRMFLEGEIQLIPEVNTKAITSEHEQAAVHVGGQDKHLVRVYP